MQSPEPPYRYEAIAALLWRFIGIVIIAATLIPFLIAFAASPENATRASLLATLGVAAGGACVIFSKPLGRIIAAGLG